MKRTVIIPARAADANSDPVPCTGTVLRIGLDALDARLRPEPPEAIVEVMGAHGKVTP